MSPDKIRQLITLMDLTCLDDDADAQRIQTLCAQANDAPENVASICIYPQWISLAKSCLNNKATAITTVVNFPEPTLDQKNITVAIHQALNLGADEIDIVFPYLTFDVCDTAPTLAWLRSARAACPNAILKVIIESGQAPSQQWIEAATQCVVESGANFVKTSTGKGFPGASPDAVTQMAYALHESDTPCGLKISGGIRTLEQAQTYRHIIKTILGESFITPQWCRIGASQLLTDCLNHL